MIMYDLLEDCHFKIYKYSENEKVVNVKVLLLFDYHVCLFHCV